MSQSQHHRAASVRGQHGMHPRFTERRLAAVCSEAVTRLKPAFLAVVAHLPRGFEPRFTWTNRRRKDNPLPCPSIAAVEAAQMAMLAAIRTGNHDVIEETAHAIQCYGAEIVAAMLAPYTSYANGEVSLVTAGLDANKEIGEAAHAIAKALVTKSSTDLDVAVKEATEGEFALKTWLSTARLSVQRPQLHALRS